MTNERRFYCYNCRVFVPISETGIRPRALAFDNGTCHIEVNGASRYCRKCGNYLSDPKLDDDFKRQIDEKRFVTKCM